MSNSYRSSIPQKLAEAQARAVLVTEKTARDIEAGCKVRSRVDTGEMKNGWQALQLGDLEWEVANHVNHVIYNEYGTRHMSAQPMLGPSVEQARPVFEAAISRIFGS